MSKHAAIHQEPPSSRVLFGDGSETMNILSGLLALFLGFTFTREDTIVCGKDESLIEMTLDFSSKWYCCWGSMLSIDWRLGNEQGQLSPGAQFQQ